MDYLYSSHINERIARGDYPSSDLRACSNEIIHTLDIQGKAQEALSILREVPDLLYTLVSAFIARFHEIEDLQQPAWFEKEVNFVINTKFNPSIANINSSAYQEAVQLCPFVTTIDKALWYGICTYGLEISNGDPAKKEDMTSFFFAFLYLFQIVQEKERQLSKTINISAVKPSTPLFDLLTGSWETCSKPYYIPLSAHQICAFNDLSQVRRRLCEQLNNEITNSDLIAKQTNAEWNQFLTILNDLSLNEAVAIEKICAPLSTSEKYQALKNYNSTLQNVEKGFYLINGEPVALVPMLEAVNLRMYQAPHHCIVQDHSGESTRLHPVAPMLIMKPETFNGLFLAYHEMRLKPQLNNAKKFALIALTSIKKNLELACTTLPDSIDEIVKEFCSSVVSFAYKHRDALERLSFKQLQQDSVSFGEVSLSSIIAEAYNNHLTQLVSDVREQFDNANSEEILKQITTTSNKSSDLAAQLSEEERQLQDLADTLLARQLVISINIIYLFSDALRIMQENQFLNSTISRDARKLLRRIDRELVKIVYPPEIDIEEHREDVGIIASSLSDRERIEESSHNWTFINAFKEAVTELINGLESNNEASLLATKKLIREEILLLPSCEYKEQLGEWLDEISDRICGALVRTAQANGRDYQNTRNLLLSLLGSEAQKLPPTALNALTTAELLYSKYASNEYALSGFDYSCISALYYQAFEESYNKLIWHGYADMLNNLPIGEQSFTSILFEHKKNKQKVISHTGALGYLPPRLADLYYYVDFKKELTTKVKSSCMYGSFAKILAHITVGTELDKLCDYFAKLTGFSSRDAMFNDTDFMNMVEDFSITVSNSSQSRNNASHGGSLITIEQCKNDKQTILSELEEVRKDSIGLIQKLLYLMRNSTITFAEE